MSNRVRQLPAFNGVPASLGSGQTVVVTCPLTLGQRVHVINLEFGNDGATNPGQGLGTLAALGMVNEIRVVLNGKVQRKFTGAELNYINSLNNPLGSTKYSAKTSGTAAAAGFRTRIPIFFAQPWRGGTTTKNIGGNNVEVPLAETTAWNLVGSVQTASIEVELIGRTSAGANAILDGPVITGTYEYDLPNATDIGPIVKYRRQSFNAGATPSDITQFDKNAGIYSMICLFATSDNHYATAVKVTRNGEEYRNDVTRAQNDMLLQSRDMSPAQGATSALTPVDTTSNATKQNTGVYPIVFDYDDAFHNALSTSDANEFTVRVTYDAAPNGLLVAISEVLGNLD
ncbi:MAG: hypothetical protein ACXWC8_00330 [Limisphaerales bacterium]